MNGYILLHKQLTKWKWYKNINTKSVFIHLLLTATWAEYRYKNVTLQRGQLIMPIKQLANETGLTEKQCRLAMSKLEETDEIRKEKINQQTVITITKYDMYQETNAKVNIDDHKVEINNKYMMLTPEDKIFIFMLQKKITTKDEILIRCHHLINGYIWQEVVKKVTGLHYKLYIENLEE